MNPNPNEGQVVVGIILVGERILVGQVREENKVNFANLDYIFPGGKVELGETSKEAVTREIKEEIGIEIDGAEMIAQRKHPLTQKQIDYFICRYEGEVPKEPTPENADISKIILIKKEDLPKYMPTIFGKVLDYFGIEVDSEKISLR